LLMVDNPRIVELFASKDGIGAAPRIQEGAFRELLRATNLGHIGAAPFVHVVTPRFRRM
jgi:hypothetical protein